MYNTKITAKLKTKLTFNLYYNILIIHNYWKRKQNIILSCNNSNYARDLIS